MVLSARIVSPSSECTTLCLVVETVTTLYDENQAFLDAAPKTSTGAVTSLVRKPSYTRMPIVDVAARAGMARPPAKNITAARTASRLGAFIAISFPISLDPRQNKRPRSDRSEEHTSELQSQSKLVCRLLL